LIASDSKESDVDTLFENIKTSHDLLSIKCLELNNNGTIICSSCAQFKKQAPKHLCSNVKASFSIFEFVEQLTDRALTQRFHS
jgi:recombinational DNA repair protein RecR